MLVFVFDNNKFDIGKNLARKTASICYVSSSLFFFFFLEMINRIASCKERAKPHEQLSL